MNYNQENLVPVPVENIQPGTLAIKVGNEIFTAGNVYIGEQLSESVISQNKNVITISQGKVSQTQTIALPLSDVSRTEDKITITEGWIEEGHTFEIGNEFPNVSITSGDQLLAGVTATDKNGGIVTGTIQNGTIQEPLFTFNNEEFTLKITVNGSKGFYKNDISETFTMDASSILNDMGEAEVESNFLGVSSGGVDDESADVVVALATGRPGYMSPSWYYEANAHIPAIPYTEYTPGTIDITIPMERWLNGNQIIKGDSNLQASNIKKGVTIFDVTGTLEAESSELPTVSLTTSEADKLLAGCTALDSNGNVVSGKMQELGSTIEPTVVLRDESDSSGNTVTLDIYTTTPNDYEYVESLKYYRIHTFDSYRETTYIPGTTDQKLKEGYYLSGDQIIKGDANLKSGNIKKGVSIFGVTGSLEESTGSSSTVQFGVVDEDGKFQPLDGENMPPTAVGNPVAGEFYTFNTDRQQESSGASGGESGSFVKVTNFVAPYDAYTSVTAINVSGFGMLNNEMEGTEEDFSKYNGVYSITPTTANETEFTSRIFKHPTEEMYIFFAQEQDYGEGDCWCFNRSVDTYFSAYEALAFKTGRELPNGQTTWSKVYYDQPTLTTTHITSDIPAQELVLEGFSATRENGVWNIGAAVTLSGYDKTPLKYGIYAVAENKLIGDAIAYHTDMYMPTDGLLAYFPMDDSGNIAVDVVNGLKLTKMGKSLVNGVTGVQGTCWENFSEQNNALSGVNTVFDLPEEFTISACVFYNGQESWRDCLPIIDFGSQQKDTGFGIRVGGRETARYSLRIASEETGDHISNVPNQSWHTITFTWQKNSNGDFTAKGYLDGQKVYESDWDSYYAISNSAQISMFGRGGTFETTSASVPCKIDEVMLWNRVLSADEVAQLVIR